MTAQHSDHEARRIESVYNRYARDPRQRRRWDAANPGNREIRTELAAAIIGAARPVVGSSALVLDVGCGAGWAIRALVEAGHPPEALAGVDVLESRVAAARQRCPGAAIDRADARTLPHADGAASLVLLISVLSSAPDPAVRRAMLHEARRVLDDHGSALVYELRVSNPLNPHTRLVNLAREAPACGLRVEQSRPLTVCPPLARCLPAGQSASAYRTLKRVRPLLTHRLTRLRPEV